MNPRSPGTFRTIVFVFLAIGLVALALSGYLTPISRALLAPIISAQTWLSERFLAIQTALSAPSDVTQLRQHNAALEAEVARLETQIIELQQQLAEYEIFSTLLDFARAYPEYDYIGASVIGRDPSPFLQYVIINRGSDDGLRRGMPVVTQQGLVGRIASVRPLSANVELLTDPGSVVNVRLQPSRAEAQLSGSLTGDLLLDWIPQKAAVEPGDLVLTSGLGGNYPANILIGQVTSVRSQDFDLYQSGSVQPVVDFTQLEIVLVITNFTPADITPQSPVPGTP